MVPLILDRDRLIGHVARANPLWRRAGPVLVSFTLTDGYVSPSWYSSKQTDPKVVPTWNYVMVLVRGQMRAVHEGPAKRDIVERLTSLHEDRVDSDWAVSDAPADFIDRLLGAIVRIEVDIDEIEGKAKLSQNRIADDVAGVAAATPDPTLAHAMAELDLPPT